MKRIIFLLMVATTVCGWQTVSRGESVLELLSGFDADRVEAAYPPSDSKTFGELAKMVFRLQKTNLDTIGAKVSPEGFIGASLGDAGKFEVRSNHCGC